MKVAAYFFSGTGNTAWVVERLAARLTDLGDEVITRSCECLSPADVDPAACDVLGVAFPVYASSPPSLMDRFIAGLPATADKPLFVLTTAGYAAGDTAWYAARPLRAKGYAPFLLANVIVANNLRLPLLSPFPIPSRDELRRRLARAQQKVERLADLIHERRRCIEGAGLLGRALGLLQRAGAGPLEALAFRGFYADQTCTRCGWCVEHCPVGNIEMADSGVIFLDHCMLCMRCYSFCPSQAIQSTSRTQDSDRYPRYPGPEGGPYLSD